MGPLRQFGRSHVWTVALAGFLISTSVFAAPAARVEFAVGGVTAEAADGRVRTLQKGAAVEEGEVVNTNEGRAQLRFTDDGFISLHSQTVFRIDEYRWSGVTDGSERGFFRLVKGGLRTITGKLAKINKKAYRMSTVVATIGIRGTEYTMQLNGDLSGSVAEGEIEVCNAGGCLAVAPGQYYYVTDANSRPIFSNKQTYLAPPQPLRERSLVGGTVSGVTRVVSGLGLRADDPAKVTGNLLNATTSALMNALDVTTSNLFSTVETTATGLIAFTQGTADSLLGGTVLNQPVQDVTGAVGGALTGTTSALSGTTGGLLDTTGAAIGGMVHTVTGVGTGSVVNTVTGAASGGVVNTVTGAMGTLTNGINGSNGLLGNIKLGF